MKRCCPEGKPVIWERTTVHVSSRAIGLLDFNRSDTQIYLSAWPPGSPGQKWCVFLLEHQGHQWQCHMQAEYTGRLSFASISPQTSAGPVKDLILGSGGVAPPLSRDGLQPRLSPSSASGPVALGWLGVCGEWLRTCLHAGGCFRLSAKTSLSWSWSRQQWQEAFLA